MRIGVTGHVNLTPRTQELVYGALRDALRPHSGPGLVALTCLAPGADQIFARVVLELGGQVEAVLPARDYRDAALDAAGRQEFDALIARASSVRYSGHLKSGREAYVAARQIVLNESDLVLAVWDGEQSAQYASTASMVRHARAVDVPVTVVWPAGAERS
jgi:hypothetical protein